MRYDPIYKMERFCSVIAGEKPVTPLPPFSVRKQSTNLKLLQICTSFLLYTLLVMFKAQNESILVDSYYQNRAFILKEGTIAVIKI